MTYSFIKIHQEFFELFAQEPETFAYMYNEAVGGNYYKRQTESKCDVQGLPEHHTPEQKFNEHTCSL